MRKKPFLALSLTNFGTDILPLCSFKMARSAECQIDGMMVIQVITATIFSGCDSPPIFRRMISWLSLSRVGGTRAV